ncbi:MAG: ferrous iron transport protein A [Lachnospiraceae bacterium]|jgi:ferrous iron transport protein A|nr:ferrous iron transport protein A [Lachnospiraceae bacterium]
MSKHPCLNDMNPGQSAHVIKLNSSGSIRRRLLDLGLTEHTQIQCVGKSPSGDPAAFLIRGAVIAIRAIDGKDILVDL